MRQIASLLPFIIPIILGCAAPRTISVYDEECKVVAKQMVLDVKASNAVVNCSNEECVGEAVMAGIVLATTTVVSGSIVVAGNVVYWLEKKRNCQAIKTVPEPSSIESK